MVTETMTLENSLGRNRAVTAMLATGAKLLEVGTLEALLEALEAAADHRTADEPRLELP